MMQGAYGFGSWGIFGMFFHLVLLVGVVYLIIYLFQGVNRTNRTNSLEEKTSLQILEERYVRDEISEEEFKQKKKILRERK